MSKAPKSKKLRPTEISLFCSQVSLFLHAGLSLVEGLTLLLDDVSNPAFSEVIKRVSAAVEQRQPFAEAMMNTRAFPAHLIKMVNIGELSGNLDEVMASMSDYYEREGQLKARIRNSVTYPVILIVMMCAVVLLLIVRVLPMFDNLLHSIGQDMPAVARGLMSFGGFLGDFWWIILGVVVLLFLIYHLMKVTVGGRAALDRFKAGFFMTRKTYQKMAAERFAAAMAFLLRSGVDLDTALQLSQDILGNAYMAKKIEICRKHVAEGESLSDALYQAKIFPRLFTRMLGIGFKTGNLDEMMLKLADMYEQEVDNALHRITGAIEPTFVALLSIVVGIILVSVMLPLIQFMSQIG